MFSSLFASNYWSPLSAPLYLSPPPCWCSGSPGFQPNSSFPCWWFRIRPVRDFLTKRPVMTSGSVSYRPGSVRPVPILSELCENRTCINCFPSYGGQEQTNLWFDQQLLDLKCYGGQILTRMSITRNKNFFIQCIYIIYNSINLCLLVLVYFIFLFLYFLFCFFVIKRFIF